VRPRRPDSADGIRHWKRQMKTGTRHDVGNGPMTLAFDT
jgi:hypothetical protein